MIALLDNYDSFTWNLVQLCSGGEYDIKVFRNDEITVELLEQLHPEALILSPGPGRPEDAGILMDAIEAFEKRIPILGVCLGHQAICQVHGTPVVHAGKLMHGKSDQIDFDEASPIFEKIEKPFFGARYHSLAAKRDQVSEDLKIIARSQDGEIMGVQLRDYPVYGIQFHPESILTPQGKTILKNFLSMINKGEKA